MPKRSQPRLIFREARLLDTGEWADWVAMYSEDAVFWVPAWLDEYTTTSDPRTQVSLLYHDARRGLEERIARIESRKSITAPPLPRTVHQISNLEASGDRPRADHLPLGVLGPRLRSARRQGASAPRPL